MALALEIPMKEIEAFCRKWQITELAIFGSALRDDFGPESDVDFLVTFAPDACITLIGLGRAENELAEIIGRRVDLVDRRGVERSSNYIRRNAILSSLMVIYAA